MAILCPPTAKVHGFSCPKADVSSPPDLQPFAGASGAGDAFGTGSLPQSPPYSRTPQENLRELVRQGGVLTPVQSGRLEELFAYCRERKIDPKLLFPVFSGLFKNPQWAASVTKDMLIAQLMAAGVMLDLQTHFIPGNFVYDRLSEERRELIHDFIRTILPLLENWSVHPIVLNNVEEMGDFARAEYHPREDAYVLRPLEHLPPFLHHAFQEMMAHELFHAYQDVKEKANGTLEIEDGAHLVGGLAIYAIADIKYEGNGHGTAFLYGASGASAPSQESPKRETSAGTKFLTAVYPEFSPGQEGYSLWELNLGRCRALFDKDAAEFDKINLQFLEKLARYHSLTDIVGIVSDLLEKPMTPEEVDAVLERAEKIIDGHANLLDSEEEEEEEEVIWHLSVVMNKAIMLYKRGDIHESRKFFKFFAEKILPRYAVFLSLTPYSLDGIPSKPVEVLGEEIK